MNQTTKEIGWPNGNPIPPRSLLNLSKSECRYVHTERNKLYARKIYLADAYFIAARKFAFFAEWRIFKQQFFASPCWLKYYETNFSERERMSHRTTFLSFAMPEGFFLQAFSE